MKADERHSIRFLLNDRPVEIHFGTDSPLSPTTTVLKYLRSLPGFTGTKEGCAEGDCGACTVILAEHDGHGKLIYRTLDSCLVFLPMIHGKQLITVEYLAQKNQGKPILHPVQQSLVDHHGTQCGFCTPGVVMSMFGLYKNHPDFSEEQIRDALAGNLCRCTGYHSILEAARSLANYPSTDHLTGMEKEVIEFLETINPQKQTLELRHEKGLYLKPFTLSDALTLKHAYPDALIISGATDVALRQTKKKERLPVILDISDIRELRNFRYQGNNWVFGAGVTLESLKHWACERFRPLHDLLAVFGSKQIRNLATLGGNLGSASPIGDLLPLLMVTHATIEVQRTSSSRWIPIHDFIKGYRKTALNPDELITSVSIPEPGPEEIIRVFKVSRRTDMDISTVSAAFLLILQNDHIGQISIAYGGMAETPVRAVAIEEAMTGKPWNRKTIEEIQPRLKDYFHPISDARADAWYRSDVAANLLMKFYLSTLTPIS